MIDDWSPAGTAPEAQRVLVVSRYGVVIASQNAYGDWSRDLAHATPGDRPEEFYLVPASEAGITHWAPLPSAKEGK